MGILQTSSSPQADSKGFPSMQSGVVLGMGGVTSPDIVCDLLGLMCGQEPSPVPRFPCVTEEQVRW